jgi:hypothetical protein
MHAFNVAPGAEPPAVDRASTRPLACRRDRVDRPRRGYGAGHLRPEGGAAPGPRGLARAGRRFGPPGAMGRDRRRRPSRGRRVAARRVRSIRRGTPRSPHRPSRAPGGSKRRPRAPPADTRQGLERRTQVHRSGVRFELGPLA